MKNWYYYMEIKRLARFIKSFITGFANKLKYGDNTTDILKYKAKPYVAVSAINEYQSMSAYYGLSTIINKYAGTDFCIPATIEHGVYFGTISGEIDEYNLPCVITFGDERQYQIRKGTDRPIFRIGPYISYVKVEEDLSERKEKIGKTLIVFPSHSFEKSNVDYNADEFIDFIKKFCDLQNINTVLVSLYFTDLEKYAEVYEAYGWKVVCSGHRMDSDFLVRQRKLFELSDYVITNDVGTHIGYAVALGKPVSMFGQEVKLSANEGQDPNSVNPFMHTGLYRNTRREVRDTFSGFYTDINDNQKKVVEKYWGVSYKRNPEEMREVLMFIQRIWKKSRYQGTNYKEIYLKELSNIKDGSKKELLEKLLE